MTSFEDNTHVFIVRVWLERREIEDASAVWRGMIEHVPSRERRHFKGLDEMVDFVAPYLERMGVRFGTGWRVKKWLNRCTISWKKQS
jgi:hypothetical protein